MHGITKTPLLPKVPFPLQRLMIGATRLRGPGADQVKMLGSLEMLGILAREDGTGMCDKRILHKCGFETLEESERPPDQGASSTDCGMNCHKQCKDLVVFECKKRAKNSAAPTENSTSVGPTSNLCSLGAKDLLHGK